MAAEEKFYSHVQPFDTKFIVDFLSDELFIDNGDLKFLSWDDLDRALESDSALKEKLSNIAREKKIDELKKIASQMTRDIDHEVVSYIPYEGTKNYKYNNNENDIFYYYTNDLKRSAKNANNVEELKKLFAQ